MIKTLVNKLIKAETRDEILSYKSETVDLYNSLYEKMVSRGFLCKTNFEDIKSLHDLEFPMMPYYGPCFYEECGIPFLKEHNPTTIDILELVILFYSLQIMNLIEDGFYDDTSLCIYKEHSDIPERMEKINLTEYKYKQTLFTALWFYFMKVITIEENTCEFSIEYDNKQDIFYLTSEKYEHVLDMLYKNLDDSNYFGVINKILGIYSLRFTKMEYVLKHQPLFVCVGYKFLCTLVTKD